MPFLSYAFHRKRLVYQEYLPIGKIAMKTTPTCVAFPENAVANPDPLVAGSQASGAAIIGDVNVLPANMLSEVFLFLFQRAALPAPYRLHLLAFLPL